MSDALVVAIVLGLFGLLLFSIEVGRRVGLRRLRSLPEPDGATASGGFGVIEGAVFALLGLLLAFTFSGAAARFDARRQLLVVEANAIGTAYLRLDLLPAGPRATLRQMFGRYLDARVAVYRHSGSFAERIHSFDHDMVRVTALQSEIWAQAVAASRLADTPAAPMLLLPALNDMIDITTTRSVALRTHTPILILALLIVLALACSALAGHGMAGFETRSWMHVLSFTAILGITLYVILDYEFPRVGLIRVDAWDQLLVELRRTMP